MIRTNVLQIIDRNTQKWYTIHSVPFLIYVDFSGISRGSVRAELYHIVHIVRIVLKRHFCDPIVHLSFFEYVLVHNYMVKN